MLTPFDRTLDSLESTIARTLKVSRNTMRAAIASDGPPKYERKPAGSAVDAFEDAIRAQLELAATVIAERVGCTRGIAVSKERGRRASRAECCGLSRVADDVARPTRREELHRTASVARASPAAHPGARPPSGGT